MSVDHDPASDRNEIPAIVQQADSQSTGISADIRALSLRKFRWKTQQDIDMVEDLFDDELVFVHITGQVSSKDEWIDEMRSGRFVYERITPKQEATVDVSGDTATLQGRAVFAVSMRGFRTSYDISYTEIYRRKRGAWKLVGLKTQAY